MDKSNRSDQLYAAPMQEVIQFAFGDDVATVFSDMIQRSVPGYSAIVAMIGVLAQRYAQADSMVYDLGCSLGAATIIMRHRIPHPLNCHIMAVDKSFAMSRRCQDNLNQDNAAIPVNVICADIAHVVVNNASVVVLNFTLQFIAPAQRRAILSAIYHGMRPGGILILSEKVDFEDPQEEAFQTEMHHSFKRLNGYSDLEISQKRTALENVLIADSIDQHLNRLKAIGFQQVYKWYQCFNFVSIVALK